MTSDFKTFLTMICLIATGIVSLATSKRSDHPETSSISVQAANSYLVSSNCPEAIQQLQISIQNQKIVSPANTSFSDFGLPMNSFSPSSAAQINGLINGAPRICTFSTSGVSQTISDVYVCYNENNQFVCRVSLEPIF